jgi:hypothetical protein
VLYRSMFYWKGTENGVGKKYIFYILMTSYYFVLRKLK